MTTHTLQTLIAAGAELLDDKAAAALLDVSPGTLNRPGFRGGHFV